MRSQIPRFLHKITTLVTSGSRCSPLSRASEGIAEKGPRRGIRDLKPTSISVYSCLVSTLQSTTQHLTVPSDRPQLPPSPETEHKVSVTRHFPRPHAGTAMVKFSTWSPNSVLLWTQLRLIQMMTKNNLIRALHWKQPYLVNIWQDREPWGWTQRGTDIIKPLQEGESIGTNSLESKGSMNTTPNMISFEPQEKSLTVIHLVKYLRPCRSPSKTIWSQTFSQLPAQPQPLKKSWEAWATELKWQSTLFLVTLKIKMLHCTVQTWKWAHLLGQELFAELVQSNELPG